MPRSTTSKLKIADFELKTDKPTFAENTFNRWNIRFPKTSYIVNYQDISTTWAEFSFI
jgi:hypothetical protein